MKIVIGLVGCAILLTCFVVGEQLLDPYWAGFEVVVQRHQDMLNREAHFYNPWQYRILSPYMIEGVLRLWEGISPPSLPTPEILAERGIVLTHHLPFILVKWISVLCIFLLSTRYYTALGISQTRYHILGMWLIAFFLYPAQFSADLSLDIYLETLFYLGAALLIIKGKEVWLPLLCIFAALNRESSGFIPFMLLAYFWVQRKSIYPLPSLKNGVFLLCCVAYLGVFVGLRWYFGYPSGRSVYGNESFLDFFSWNLSQPTTYYQLLRSFTLIPILAIWFFPKWPTLLRTWAYLILPVWVLLHFGHAVVRETRLFLVPVCLILIPGILLGFQPIPEEEKGLMHSKTT